MTCQFEQGLTVEAAIDILTGTYDDDELGNVEALYIAPPDSNVLTDEDSAGEDESGLVDNLSGRQLSADAELRITGNNYLQNASTEENINRLDHTSGSEQATKTGENSKILSQTSHNDNIRTNLPQTYDDRPRKKLKKTTAVQKKSSEALEQMQTDKRQRNFDGVIGELLSDIRTERQAKKKKKPITKKWNTEADIEATNLPFPKADFSRYRDFSACELFELFFDDDVYDMLVRETARYAIFKNQQNPNITKENIKCFIGILIFSGYHTLPGKRYYWDSQTDMNQPFIVNSMRRNKFDQIMSLIHCADNNNIDTGDKLYKLRPLISMLQSRFQEHFIPVQYLSYDESMIEYYGRHGCKQFIRAKPIRFGYKVWCVNAPLGYLMNFEIYQGKSLNMPSEYEELFGKSSALLVKMLEKLPGDKKDLPYICVFDNLFSNFPLLKFLREIGYGGISTIREDRLPPCCPLLPKKNIQNKFRRGHCVSALNMDDGILVCKWHDNGVVSLASNTHGVQPIGKVERYSQAEKKTILVDRPNLVKIYNENMDGTDRLDENVANYRISVRGKKWYWPIFTWLIDVAIQNAWQFSRSSGVKQPQLDFRREIVQSYITRYGEVSKGPGRPMTSRQSLSCNRISDDIRYDGVNHHVVSVPDKKRRRCAGEECDSSICTMYKKCNFGLCIKCFDMFHTKTFI
ncbi:piggyBac transposable element-derived protein 3-like [Nilaparvata lugens]|uniref:piggyBac transposable element-derived protein 3-like n=1 Tax=Nilaparvata lugens TaxID=108931 RepID=UPI00193DDAE1|nr:piggyBac transposable element-derived protein 3-like [Nilaparvata lugens]